MKSKITNSKIESELRRSADDVYKACSRIMRLSSRLSARGLPVSDLEELLRKSVELANDMNQIAKLAVGEEK